MSQLPPVKLIPSRKCPTHMASRYSLCRRRPLAWVTWTVSSLVVARFIIVAVGTKSRSWWVCYFDILLLCLVNLKLCIWTQRSPLFDSKLNILIVHFQSWKCSRHNSLHRTHDSVLCSTWNGKSATVSQSPFTSRFPTLTSPLHFWLKKCQPKWHGICTNPYHVSNTCGCCCSWR